MTAPLDFSHLTTDPSTLSIVRPRGIKRVPGVTDPADQPLVLDPTDDPLVRLVEAERLRIVPAYLELPGGAPFLLAREEVADRAVRASKMLPTGFGLAVLDAWRPLVLQQHLFDVAYANPDLPEGFVTPPSADPETPPPHLTGGTLDVTLTWRGVPLSLGTDFDDFTETAHVAALEGTMDPSRDLRRLLFWTMQAAGFAPIWCEWWHFEFGTRRWAAANGTDPLYGPATA